MANNNPQIQIAETLRQMARTYRRANRATQVHYLRDVVLPYLDRPEVGSGLRESGKFALWASALKAA